MNRKLYAPILFLIVVFLGPFVVSNFGLNEIVFSRTLGIAFIGLLCVLFGEGLGSYAGSMWTVGRVGTHISRTSPPEAVELLGWVFLLIPIMTFLFAFIF